MINSKVIIKIEPWIIQGFLVLACIILAYHQAIQGLIAQWGDNGNYSYGMFILPMSAYIVWERRRQLRGLPVGTDWRALLLLLIAGAVYVVGDLGAELFTTRVSMILLFIGVVWLLFGAQIVKAIRFPLIFLFLMLPLPGMVYRNITFPLQIFSSEMAVRLLRLLGVIALREGNIIDLGFIQLQVAEACSGLRYLLPFFALGVFLSFYDRKSIWERIVLISMTIPIGIAANIVRIAGTGIMTNLWGPKAAEGFLHSFSGWAVFMFCVVAFVAMGWGLHCLAGKSKDSNIKPDTVGPVSAGRIRLPWYGAVVAVVFILVLPRLVNYFGNVPPVNLKQPLSDFPLALDGWHGTRLEMSHEIWERVGGQEYALIDYRKAGTLPVDFYVAYYSHQRKAGDFIHSPKLCLPGSGWYIDQASDRQLTGGTASSRHSGILKFNELLIEKNGERRLVYYWFQGRERNFTNEYAAKFYMVWDGIFRRRTDGALVRLFTPIPDNGTVQQARKIMDPFAVRVSSLLDKFLP